MSKEKGLTSTLEVALGLVREWEKEELWCYLITIKSQRVGALITSSKENKEAFEHKGFFFKSALISGETASMSIQGVEITVNLT